MKTRLTITLPPDLLKSIDSLVDKITIRNRSHAIENLIRQSISSNISTAVILAGGSHHGNENTLLKLVADENLFVHQVNHLKKYDIKNIIVCLNKKEEDLQKTFGNGSTLGVSIQYSFEATDLGTAGALKKASKYFNNQESVVVLHGDILTSIALDELIDFHLAEEAAVTLAVKPRIGKKELGQVYVQGSRVTTFAKSGIDSEISIINTGVYILSCEVISSLPQNECLYLETDVFPKLAQEGKLRAFIFQGIWYDISTEDQYQKALKIWAHR
jgi:NDP-sugar pyrophosphorylase family protein